MLELVQAPINHPDMLWMAIPIIITLFLMQFYFGLHKEELGWNSAVANSLVLVFVSIDLFRFIYNYSAPPSSLNWLLFPVKSLVAFIVIFEGVLLFFTDFLHFLPKKLAFIISSSLPVNVTAYIAVALVYTNIEINWITLIAAVILLFIAILFFTVLKTFLHVVFRVRSEKK